MKTRSENKNETTKPWKGQDGKFLDEAAIKQVSKNWDAETWELYLQATVDVDLSPYETTLDEYEALLEETSEGIWEGPLHVPKRVRRKISAAIKQLSKPQQEIIWLFYWREFPHTKIAKKLGVTHQNVAKMKNFSLSKIEDLLKNQVEVASYLIGGSKVFDPKPLSRIEQILEIYFLDLKGSYLK